MLRKRQLPAVGRRPEDQEQIGPPLGEVLHALLGRTWYAVVALVAAAGLVPQMASPAVPDLSWLLYVAGRLLDGARLNVDVVEINPAVVPVANSRHVRIEPLDPYRYPSRSTTPPW